MLDVLDRPMPTNLVDLRHYLRAALTEIDRALENIASGAGLDVYLLPESDPGEKGLLWIDEDRNLKVSAG